MEISDSSVTKILRGINFGESGSSKNAVFAILGALNFVNLANISKVHGFIKIYLEPFKKCHIHQL